jgi:anti-sigma regulatory factor (Ser/Thr protein kinase)
MAGTAAEIDPRLIAFVLPSTSESARMARFHVRAALGFHGLAQYADNAEIITSELVTNAIQHVCGDGTETVGIALARTRNPEAVTVVVSDSSPEGPAMREAPAGSERGRGLKIVEALSAHWGWHPEDGGKAIFAILAREAGA